MFDDDAPLSCSEGFNIAASGKEKAAVVAAIVKLRLQVCRSLSSYLQKITLIWRWQAGPISSFAI